MSSGFLSRRVKWKAPVRGRSLITQYHLRYRKGSSKEAHEKWLNSDENSLKVSCSVRQNIHDIEIRPYCGDLVKGFSVCAGSTASVCNRSETSEAESNSEGEHTPDSGSDKRLTWWDGTGQKTKNPFVPATDTDARLLMDGEDEWQLGGMTILSDGRLLVTDMDNNCLRVFPLPKDSPVKSPGQNLRTSANFECPWDVTTDGKDNVYVIGNMAVHVVSNKGKLLHQKSHDIPANAGGIAAKGDRLAIIDMEANTCEIYKTGSSGDLDHDSSMKLDRRSDDRQIQNPIQGVAIDDDGNMYVSDPDKCVIQKYSPSGQRLERIHTGKINPGSLEWHSGYGLLAADMILRKIWLLTPTEKQ